MNICLVIGKIILGALFPILNLNNILTLISRNSYILYKKSLGTPSIISICRPRQFSLSNGTNVEQQYTGYQPSSVYGQKICIILIGDGPPPLHAARPLPRRRTFDTHERYIYNYYRLH